jgi:hypothetical protein
MAKSKTCWKCKRDLPLEDFHILRTSPDGRQNICKSCKSELCKERRQSDPRVRESCRKAQQRYVRRKLETDKQGFREWKRQHDRKYRAKNRKKIYSVIALWKIENPEKWKAECKTRNAIKSGKLIRPNTCSLCGEEGLIQAHHYDYKKPLDVDWLCSECHAQQDKERRRYYDFL